MTRKELKAQIPHGSAKSIAQKAGVNKITVSKWLNGTSDNVNVELAVLEIVAEVSERKNKLLARIN